MTGVRDRTPAGERVDAATLATVKRMVAERGYAPTAEMLGTGVTVVDRLLGPGIVRVGVLARVRARLAEIENGRTG